MKNFLSFLLLIIVGGFLLVSCNKEDDNTTPKGGIKASVSPAGSAIKMVVSNGSITREASPDVNNAFEVDNLEAGAYTVSFTPATNFQAPASQTVNVIAGNINNLGTITLNKSNNDKGRIIATVSPVGSATKMIVSNGTSTREAQPNANNAFEIDNLEAGVYTVSFTPAINYQAPQNQSATVTIGNTTDLGTIIFTFKGGIRATVAPAGSATKMTVTNGIITRDALPDANSTFEISDLEAGNYTVSFTPASNFQKPSDQTTSVSAGNITDLGIITLSGVLLAFVNGNNWTSHIADASVNGSDVLITGSYVAPNQSFVEGISISLKNVTGIGTFSGPLNATATFLFQTTSQSIPSVWTSASGGTCTVTITKFDQIGQKISGTFSFTANPMPNNSASGIKTVTNGTFTDVKLQ